MHAPLLPSVIAGLVSTVRRSTRLIVPALGALLYACTDVPTEPTEPTADPVSFASVVTGTTYVVNTSDDFDNGTCDAAHCSLREALNAANGNPGMDAIHFSIPAPGPYTIVKTTWFPAVFEVVLDGTTQPGFSGSPIIVLDGSAFPSHGLTIAGDGNATVKGLKITGFSRAGIAFTVSSSNSTIQGNYLMNNRLGISIRGGGNNLIGGTTPSERNVISGNLENGISFGIGAQSNRIQGNYIGTTPTGMLAQPNGASGLFFRADLARDIGNNLIGGPEPGAGNVISGNTTFGIAFDGNEASVGGNVIEGNLIGTGADGVSALGNGNSGVFVRFDIDDTQVLRNTIAFNGHHGILLAGTATRFATRALISENSIHSNGDLGIELFPPTSFVNANDLGDGDTGANNGQNYPVLTSATSGAGSVSIAGDLNSTTGTEFTLEFFANGVADPSGHGEGETFLGSVSVTTETNGDATFSVTFAATVPVGQFITATATDPDNNTSEFSAVLAVAEDPNVAPEVTSITLPSGPVAVNLITSITAGFTDANPGDTHTATIDWDDGHETAGAVTEADGSGTVTGSHAYETAGVYTITVKVTDYGDLSGSRSSTEEATNSFLVVYDPNGGFVTGGGWIGSPEGAYVAEPKLTGKANFGFVSKYKKGATVPTGNTEFKFKAGDLNFHSSSYDFLVITIGGTNAQYKGSGTINGGLAPSGSEFKFMIWARDDSPDTFRIKIWYEDGGEKVVYDNGFDQAIGGGSIVVHSK